MTELLLSTDTPLITPEASLTNSAVSLVGEINGIAFWFHLQRRLRPLWRKVDDQMVTVDSDGNHGARPELITTCCSLQSPRGSSESFCRRATQSPQLRVFIAQRRPAILAAPGGIENSRGNVGSVRVPGSWRRATAILNHPIEHRERMPSFEVHQLRTPEIHALRRGRQHQIDIAIRGPVGSDTPPAARSRGSSIPFRPRQCRCERPRTAAYEPTVLSQHSHRRRRAG